MGYNELIFTIFAEDFDSMMKYLYTLFISMLPIIELRGAIPVGAASGLPWYINYLLC